MDELILPTNAVYDNPSEYDILWEDYAEGGESKKVLDQVKLKVRNQNENKDTYKACSAYGLTYCYNGYQAIEYKKNGLEFEQDDPRWKREAFQAERGYPNSGASLQDMMCFFKKRGLIDGYVRCKTAQECKNAINNGCLIYTGSNKCNWSKAGKNKEFYYDPNGAAHCFAVVDYYDGGLIAINSFGETWGDGGYFKIPDAEYEHIYSTYAVIDHDDTGKLGELVFNAQFQKAIELGITNGTRPNDPATRQETAVMLYRLYKKILDTK